jgi:hypothetical protein
MPQRPATYRKWAAQDPIAETSFERSAGSVPFMLNREMNLEACICVERTDGLSSCLPGAEYSS